ncbi:hypothetical protein E1292_31760 [Nonomuraea deserti]|uniref:Amine oxidase domain-containing protein n=1 Tax=Nonomuraea deserti TaxID=1848322 RepID=A0A4R4VC26_9ACTN|nr:hypothetical protein E1292_31760 [Nonomuraea deserti]
MEEVVMIGEGQSGLAAAHALTARGRRPLVLEGRDQAGGLWPCCYESLCLFTPAWFAAGFPTVAQPGRTPPTPMSSSATRPPTAPVQSANNS